MQSPTFNSSYWILVLLFFGGISFGFTQTGFVIPSEQEKVKLPFQLVNNLVIVPVELNGKKLSFLLDTGVSSSILFSLQAQDSLEVKNARQVTIRGLGADGDVAALKSQNNVLRIGQLVDRNHSLFVVFDARINFSPRMGIPIHGVIGYDFFKNFIVKTDYVRKKLTVYNPLTYEEKRCNSCIDFDLLFDKGKPYVVGKVKYGGNFSEVNLLIDTGASDALWLFDESFGIDEEKKNYFGDFLGLGLSGGVHGKRSKMDEFLLNDFKLRQVTVSYPDSLSLENLRENENRNGTLGGEILKRFTVIMDYPGKKMRLKKNRYFNEPFHYNMAGLIIEHDGMVPVKEEIKKPAEGMSLRRVDNSRANNLQVSLSAVYSFYLAPQFKVAEVRSGSPADLAGIVVGDEIVSINGRQGYKYKLYELTELFSSKKGKKIVIEINRNGSRIKKRFVLKAVI